MHSIWQKVIIYCQGSPQSAGVIFKGSYLSSSGADHARALVTGSNKSYEIVHYLPLFTICSIQTNRLPKLASQPSLTMPQRKTQISNIATSNPFAVLSSVSDDKSPSTLSGQENTSDLLDEDTGEKKAPAQSSAVSEATVTAAAVQGDIREEQVQQNSANPSKTNHDNIFRVFGFPKALTITATISKDGKNTHSHAFYAEHSAWPNLIGALKYSVTKKDHTATAFTTFNTCTLTACRTADEKLIQPPETLILSDFHSKGWWWAVHDQTARQCGGWVVVNGYHDMPSRHPASHRNYKSTNNIEGAPKAYICYATIYDNNVEIYSRQFFAHGTAMPNIRKKLGGHHWGFQSAYLEGNWQASKNHDQKGNRQVCCLTYILNDEM